MTPRVLLVESDPPLAADLERAAKRAGYEAWAVGTLQDAIRGLREASFDVVVLEVRGEDSLGDLTRVQGAAAGAALLATCTGGTAALAVETLRRGALRFLRKPFTLFAWEEALAAAAATRPDPPGPRLLTGDPTVRALLEQARAVARTDATLHIVGESGTGKDLLARFVHFHAARRAGPRVVIDCATLSRDHAEVELFGRVAGDGRPPAAQRHGAVEAAHGGTLVLRNVDEVPAGAQGRLLELVQERELWPVGGTAPRSVDLRVVATSREGASRGAGRLRRDLQLRLDVVVLRLPPLRARGADLELLARHFLERFALEQGVDPPRLGPASLGELARHPFGGNVRELANLMRRALLLAPGADLDVGALLRRSTPEPGGSGARRASSRSLRELERSAIETSLLRSRGNRQQASRELGISVRTLRNKIRRHGLA